MTVAQRKLSIYDAQQSWLANIHHANHQPLGDIFAQRKWSIYEAQQSWLANIHHPNHQPLGDSRPTEMKYIWRPTVLASKYTYVSEWFFYYIKLSPDQCWLTFNKILWHSFYSNIYSYHKASKPELCLKYILEKSLPHLVGANELRYVAAASGGACIV